MYKESLRGMFSLETRELRGDMITAFKYWDSPCEEEGKQLFSLAKPKFKARDLKL